MGTFWDRVAGLYDLAEFTNRKVNAATRKRVGELVPAGGRVLDCAAGTGEFSLAAAQRAGSVLCTDQSEAMLKQARKKAARKGLTNISFAQRDITALPDPDGSFDAVIAGNVLHLLDKPEIAVRELWRVTAPGGRLILPTYLQGKVGATYGTMIKIYQDVGFHYEHAFTPETYREFLERLNLGSGPSFGSAERPARQPSAARVTVEVIDGKVPEGIGVLEKPI